MCDVSTIGGIGLGIQGISVLGNYLTSRKEQTSYSEYQALQTQATLSNYIQQVKSINNRYYEEAEATALQKQQIQLENMQAKATAQASAATAGIEGISIDNLFRGYDRDSAISDYVAARNLEMKGLQYNDEIDSLRIKAINAINLQESYTGSPASTLIGGIGGMLSSYANYYNRNDQTNFYRQKKILGGI